MSKKEKQEVISTEDVIANKSENPENKTVPKVKAPNIFMQFVYSLIPTKYGELAKVGVKGLIFFILLESFLSTVARWIDIVGNKIVSEGLVLDLKQWLTLIGLSIPICIVIGLLQALVYTGSALLGRLPAALLVSAITRQKCSLFDLFKVCIYSRTCWIIVSICYKTLNADMPWWLEFIVSFLILIFSIFYLPNKPFLPKRKSKAIPDVEEQESIDKKEEITEQTEAAETVPEEKAPNIFVQFVYSLIPTKYGELAKVGIKGFLLYILFESVLLTILIWLYIVESELASREIFLNWKGEILLQVISIPVCAITSILVAIVGTVVSFFQGMPVALLISWISKQKCSLFDLFKATIYSQTVLHIATMCWLVFSWNVSWPMWIAWGVNFFVLLFGIFYLPKKPFLPGNVS